LWSANGVYAISATSAPPVIQHGIGVQTASGIALMSSRTRPCLRSVIEKRTSIARHTATTSWA